MDTSDSTIVGLFKDSARAEHAIEQLKQTGFRDDQIQATAYHPAENQNAAEGIGSAPHMPGVGGGSRFIVAVNADGKEHEAVGILVHNGANNSDLPHGMVLERGALVSGQGENTNATPWQVVKSDPGANTFFGEAKDQGHEGEIDIMDNSNFPHG